MKGSALPNKSVPNRGDEYIGIDNSASPVRSVVMTHDAAVAMAFSSLAFSGNVTAMAAGAIGTTFTDVQDFDTEGSELEAEADQALYQIVVAEDGTYEIDYGLDAFNDTGERILEMRLTADGVAVANSQRLGNAPATNRPVSLQGHVKVALVAGDAIRLQVRNSSIGGAATTGIITCVSGMIAVKKIRVAA